MNVLPLTSDAAPYESLTEREGSILALMAEGLSNREIAERLIIAYTTVKWYSTQIFNKLGVDNRRAAIERGRELHLLNADELVIVPRHNLPAQVTPFIGREREIEIVTRLLRDPAARLVTLLAPGGMGKTRLALAVAEIFVPRFPDGVYFVPLAALNEANSIITAIADSTGYPFQQDSRSPKQQILDYLAGQTALLVLDNFEHLLDGAPLVSDLLAAAPRVRVLATSRERLNLTAETVVLLDGLDYPAAADMPEALACGAVRLFVQSARRVRPDFEPDAALADIGLVCRLVQGMPLAVELAAAWVEVLSPGEIAEEITRSLDFLSTTMRDVPERLRSVRAVFAAAWARLTPDEQTVFMKLSVFRGGCTRPAAEQVAGATLAVLTALADRSLVWRRPNGRYLEHELLRQYAAEQLEMAGEADAVRAAHSAYYLDFLAAREADLKGRREIEAVQEIKADFENVQSGWLWAAQHRQYEPVGRACSGLRLFLSVSTHLADEGLRLFEETRRLLAPQPGETPHPVYGRLLLAFNLALADSTTSLEVRQHSLSIAEQSGDPEGLARARIALGRYFADVERDRAHGLALLHQGLAYFRQQRDDYETVRLLDHISMVYDVIGDEANFRACVDEYERLSEATGNPSLLAMNTFRQAVEAWRMGDYTGAESRYQTACEVFDALNNRYWMTSAHAQWAMVYAIRTGDLERASDWLQTTLEESRRLHIREVEGYSQFFLGMLVCMEEDYAEARRLSDAAAACEPHHPYLVDGCSLGLSWAACGEDDYPAACRHFRLYYGNYAHHFPGMYVLGLPTAAFIHTHNGRYESAAESLALALAHPASPVGLFQRWPLLARLRETLTAHLGADAFAAAWERGKLLDPKAIIIELESSL